jgi:ATP-dependent helicase STH1/SNF2
LHRVLEPFILRRLKEDVAVDLPNKVERLVVCPMSALQIAVFNKIREDAMKRDKTQHEQQTWNLYSQNLVMQLRKLCNHPVSIE